MGLRANFSILEALTLLPPCAGCSGWRDYDLSFLELAEAHRRLTAISEHLWDYQLRVAGTASILFTWGAVDVKRERLVDAISAATERMEQTRRTRESAFFSLNRRKAV